MEHVSAGPPEDIPKDELLPHMDQFADALAEAFRHHRPDVVHSHFWMSGRAGLAACRKLDDIPLVHTFHALGAVKRRHQGAADTSPSVRLAEEETIMRRACRIVATCTDELFELMRLGCHPDRVVVIPCGVDLDMFCPGGPTEPRREGLRRVVVLSRLVQRKGIDDVIAAVARLDGTELVVAGGPEAGGVMGDPEGRRLSGLAETLGMAHRVDFRGRVARPAIPALLRSADVVVAMPWYEPFGMVPLEAMACGAPVVVSAVGGMIDSVVDGVTGLHVPPRNPTALAAALKRLLDDDALRRCLGTKGVSRVRRRFGWPRVAASTLQVYRQVVASGEASAEEMMPS